MSIMTFEVRHDVIIERGGQAMDGYAIRIREGEDLIDTVEHDYSVDPEDLIEDLREGY